MGVLSRQAILRRQQANELIISPTPKDVDYDTDAVDVHLREKVYEWVQPPSDATLSLAM